MAQDVEACKVTGSSSLLMQDIETQRSSLATKRLPSLGEWLNIVIDILNVPIYAQEARI